MRKKWLWPNFKALSQNLPARTDENYKNLSQDSHSMDQRMNMGPPDKQAGKKRKRRNSRSFQIIKVLSNNDTAETSGHIVIVIRMRRSYCAKVCMLHVRVGWGSTVSKVSDYRPDDQGSIPGTGRGFIL
jgi:hypothetical protein